MKYYLKQKTQNKFKAQTAESPPKASISLLKPISPVIVQGGNELVGPPLKKWKKKTFTQTHNVAVTPPPPTPSKVKKADLLSPKSPQTPNDPDEEEYCLCRRGTISGEEMICCDHCEEWYHYSCIRMTAAKAKRIEKFACPACVEKDEDLETTFVSKRKRNVDDDYVDETEKKPKKEEKKKRKYKRRRQRYADYSDESDEEIQPPKKKRKVSGKKKKRGNSIPAKMKNKLMTRIGKYTNPKKKPYPEIPQSHFDVPPVVPQFATLNCYCGSLQCFHPDAMTTCSRCMTYFHDMCLGIIHVKDRTDDFICKACIINDNSEKYIEFMKEEEAKKKAAKAEAARLKELRKLNPKKRRGGKKKKKVQKKKN